jgi:hypothetical protein
MRGVLVLLMIILILFGGAIHAVGASTPKEAERRHYIEMDYVEADNYPNRLVNARAAFDQLQAFFDTVEWQPNKRYSFLNHVLHGTFDPKAGYVMTEKGYAYGACGAPSLLNHLVQTATFRDWDGSVQPVFQAVSVWTWTGDDTYGPYGATIYLDTTGTRITKDYVWKLNPAYHGRAPKITIAFDATTNTFGLTMIYADNGER